MLGCHEFCGYYEWTFHYVRQRWGQEAVVRLWAEAIGGDSQRHYAEAARQAGLAGLCRTWVKTGEEESCDWTFRLDEERNFLRFDMRRCPSKGFLTSHDLNADEDYCDHCAGWMVPLLDSVGVELYAHEHNHLGQCWGVMRMKDRPTELPDLENDIRRDPAWTLGYLDRWEHSEKQPLAPKISATTDPCALLVDWFAAAAPVLLTDEAYAADGLPAPSPLPLSREGERGCAARAAVLLDRRTANLAAVAERYHSEPAQRRPLLLCAYLPGRELPDFTALGLPRPWPILPLLIRSGKYAHRPGAPEPNAADLLSALAQGLKLMSSTGQTLYRRAKALFPGGTQLLSKRPEMFAPDQWPPYYREARGCEIVDLDGTRFIDMSLMGIGACLLGYNDPDVTAAVVARVQAGSMCTLNAPDEVELADALLSIHPWAENVRYARTGGEAMAVAVRIARARTGRDLVAFCGYHGWHDWYLAANRAAAGSTDQLRGHLLPGLAPAGVPAALAGTALPFAYNRLDELAQIVSREGGRLAAVVMEPTRSTPPAPGFLEGVRELCDQSGAVLVLDEITIGWRLCLGGAHLRWGLRPDLAVFAKALGGGHPMAAVIGTADVMQAAQESFISSTYWTEAVGPAAALATVRKMQRIDVPGHLTAIGERFRAGMAEIAARHGVPLKLSGYPALTSLSFEHPDALALQTLLTVRMLARGILAGAGFYVSLAHRPEHVDAYLAAADEIFAELAQAIRAGDAAARIGGPVRHSGFARLA